MSRKFRKSKKKNGRIQLSRNSPYSGVRFPEGFKRIAFTAYCDNAGNVRGTRRSLKDAGERVPSVKTLTNWIEENHWAVLRQIHDDGLLEHLEADEDPDIREAIKTDAGLFKFLLRLRSQLLVKLTSQESNLMPTNTNQLVRILEHIASTVNPMQARMSDADKRRAAKSDADKVDYDEVPKNVISLAKSLESRGEPVTDLNLAREAIRIKEESE